jgi:hypothetical protein
MGIGNRNNQHSFAQIPTVDVPRSRFDRSHTVKDTFDFDYLIPFYVDEVLPGDTFNCTVHSFARLATQIVPIMDNMYLDYFFFFVPNRLLMTNWKKLMGEQANPADSISYVLPTLPFSAGKPDVGTVFDKFGLPTDVTNSWTLTNTLPLRAYNLIWNTWFRDENLQNSVIENMDDGPDAESDYALLKRGKRHDYFTSALPSLQKGTAVSLSLSGTAPVLGIGTVGGYAASTPVSASVYETNSVAVQSYDGWRDRDAVDAVGKVGIHIERDPNNTLYPYIRADLAQATAGLSITDWRASVQLQALAELNMRGGTRYNELIHAHFGVTLPDFTAQRPEYLAGGSTKLVSQAVPQTSPTSGSNYQANLAAFSTGMTGHRDNIGFTKSFVEHGYVIGLVCGRADITYQQGINKMWLRSSKNDFYWPMLANLGEQAIYNKEIYMDGSANDALVFGYQERYAEYRFKPSEIHGEFRSQYATPIDQWHLAEEFSSLPSLNSTFIVQNTPVDRAIANSAAPHILFDCFINLICARPMPVYAVPANLARL